MQYYISDLEYLFNALMKHPLFIRKPEKCNEFKKYYEELCIKVKNCSYDTLAAIATDMTMFFADGHTNIELPYSHNDRSLFLPCDWENPYTDKLVLLKVWEDILQGSEIAEFENISVSELVDKMSDVIPHENRYLVKSRMFHYPYKNYHVFSEMNLCRMFGKKDSYEVTFVVEGQRIKRKISFTQYNNYPEFNDDLPQFYYEIDKNKITVHIDACICSQAYQDFLREVALVCEREHIEYMFLDLSKNMGGTTEVIGKFIAYTHAVKYRQYGTLDYAGGREEVVSDRNVWLDNIKQDILFPENIRVKVGYDTFSSARTFAVTLLDNKIAVLDGGCSGGKPDSYGAPMRDILPISKIKFRVSTRYFMRPDDTKDDEMAVGENF